MRPLPANKMPETKNIYAVAADLTIQSVTELLRLGFDSLANGVTIFDFSAVRELDSGALAFILASRREAERLGIQLQCLNLPDNLKNLAALYGVENYLSN